VDSVAYPSGGNADAATPNQDGKMKLSEIDLRKGDWHFNGFYWVEVTKADQPIATFPMTPERRRMRRAEQARRRRKEKSHSGKTKK
jgi:hypothetical protein